MWAYLQQVDWSKQYACHIQCYIPLTQHNCYITREIWIQLGTNGRRKRLRRGLTDSPPSPLMSDSRQGQVFAGVPSRSSAHPTPNHLYIRGLAGVTVCEIDIRANAASIRSGLQPPRLLRNTLGACEPHRFFPTEPRYRPVERHCVGYPSKKSPSQWGLCTRHRNRLERPFTNHVVSRIRPSGTLRRTMCRTEVSPTGPLF